jgi:membrane protein
MSPSDADKGRDADVPGDIPPAGWRDVLQRVRRRVSDDNLSITAAGVAFYALIATFPGLLALSGIYQVLFDRFEMAEQARFLGEEIQPQAMRLLIGLVEGLSSADRSHLGFGIFGGVLITVWGTSLGVRALMRALNVTYGEKEKRSLLERTIVALLLTVGAIVMAFCAGFAVLSVPILREWLQLDELLQRFVFYARWPAVAVIFWLSLVVFYRYGPSRAKARWSWVSWGAAAATALWLGGSAVLAGYVAREDRYHSAYGSVGTVVLVLAWFFLSAFSVLLGAALNAELERQTRVDTTSGGNRPAGARGAIVADTLGDSVL